MTPTHRLRVFGLGAVLLAVGACTEADKGGNAPVATTAPLAATSPIGLADVFMKPATKPSPTPALENPPKPPSVADGGPAKSTGTTTAAPDKGVAIEADAGSGKTWALVIGVKGYQSVPPLRYTAADADALAKALMEKGGVPEKQILRITDDQPDKPDHATLSKKVPEWLSRPEIQKDDTVIVFFSGHGVLGPEEVMYLAPRDIQTKDIPKTGLPAVTLREQIRACKAGTKLLLLDACHSGASKGIKIENTTPMDGERLAGAFKYAPGVVTISGCKADQFSWESNELKHGVFTYFIQEALSGRADADGNGRIDVDELYRYVSDRVPKKTQDEHKTSQDPVRWIGPDIAGIPVVLKLPAGVAKPPPTPIPNPPPPAHGGNVHTLLDEDFSKTKRGELPAGWVGDAGIGVGREADKSWLQTRTTGIHRVYTPPLPIQGDFQIEFTYQLGRGGHLGLALENEGTRDVRAKFSNNNSHLQLTLADAEERYVNGAGDKVCRAVVQREGDVFTIEVDGKEALVHRIKDAGNFERLAIDLDMTVSKLERLTVRLARPNDATPVPKPTPVADRYAFYQDFIQAKDNELPKGWNTEGSFITKQDGGIGWLELTSADPKKEKNAVQSPALKIDGNFQLESHFFLPFSSALEIQLQSDGDKAKGISLQLHRTVQGHLDARFTKHPTQHMSFNHTNHISRVVVRRVGAVYTISVNGHQLVVQPIDKTSFNSVSLNMSVPGIFVYDLGIRSLERGK